MSKLALIPEAETMLKKASEDYQYMYWYNVKLIRELCTSREDSKIYEKAIDRLMKLNTFLGIWFAATVGGLVGYFTITLLYNSIN